LYVVEKVLVSREGLVVHAGKTVNAAVSVLNNMDLLGENLTEADFKTKCDELLGAVDDAVAAIFDNGLVKAVLNEIGVAITDGKVNIDELFGGSAAEGEASLTGVMFKAIVESLANNDLAKSIKDSLSGFVQIAKDLNKDGHLYKIKNIGELFKGEFNETEFTEKCGDLLDALDIAIAGILDNSLVKTVIDEIGKAVEDNSLNIGALFGSGEGGEEVSPFGELIKKAIDALAEDGELSKGIKDDLLTVVQTARDLNDGNHLYELYSFMTAGGGGGAIDLLVFELDEPTAKELGKAIDSILTLKMLTDAKPQLFSMVVDMLLPGDAYGIDKDAIHLEYLVWEDVAGTVFKALKVFSSFNEDGLSGLGDAVTEVIDSLADATGYDKVTKEDPSGVGTLIEGLLKNMIANMNFNGVDETFLKEIRLDIYGNSERIGKLIGIFDDLTAIQGLDFSFDAEGAGFKDSLDVLEGILTKLDDIRGGDPDDGLTKLIDKLIGSMLGDLGLGGDGAIDTLINVLKFVKLGMEAMDSLEKLGAGELPDDAIGEFIDKAFDLLKDAGDTLTDFVEMFLPESGIDLGDEFSGVAESLLSDKIANAATPEDEELYKQIAGLLGIALS